MATTFAHGGAGGAREIEITWRHWGRDDPDVWFMDVKYPSPDRCLQVARTASF